MEKELEKQAEKKAKESEKQNSANSEMQKTIEKLKQKNSQLEEKVVTLDKSIADMKQKHSKELKEAADKLKEQKEGSLKHAQLKIVRMKKQIQAVKLENDYLKKLMDGYKDLEEKYKKELKERRLLYNQLQDLKGNIRVNLRVRPLLPEDGQTENCIECIDDKEVKIYDKEAKKSYKFEFDSVFGTDSTQAQVFEDVKPLATSILDGYNVCIFAYGQTGSGKTFTMEGPPNNRGVNYNTLDEVFFMIKERKGEYNYEVEVAVMEIYNENLHDLLTKDKTKLEIMLSNKVTIPGLTRIKVNSSDDVRKVLSQGYENRATGNNNINAHSSRSHCIVSVFVEGVNLYTQQKLSGKLHLIDLAGSERLKRTDVKGDRLKEAQNINKSLSALGDVISSLSSKKSHIPYRNSKLTSLLQDSLGGNSKMLMFVNVSPTVESCPETLCSLGFAQRARTVELGKAQKNIVSQGTTTTASSSNSNN
ncbi:hypothetical protein FDP41_002926 [Naegleria fowleri]|uniref:Kinesin-like protein n=1 Tax=Naegleria fowleri TaxID=5763 RepID=A0A6A5BUT6_NAEFO|nr:uncharacterized protein FDP41_002926 [Naegleria fowleri]KAF0978034.1 hypothetical protein FDP41_002926 [Naegleria fowleri]